MIKTGNFWVAHCCFFWYTLNRQPKSCLLRRKQEHLASKRGAPMTLPDQIERTLILPVPRERVWDAITKPEHLAHWLGMISDMDFRVGGAIHFTWENEPCPYPGMIEV